MCDAPILPFFESSAPILWLGIYPKVPIAGTCPTSCHLAAELSLVHETVPDPGSSCCLNSCLPRTPYCLLKYPLQRASLAQYVSQDVLGPNFSLSGLFPARVYCSFSTSHKSLVQPPPVASCLVTVTISHTSVSAFPADCTASPSQPSFRDSPQYRASWEFSVLCTCVEG